jgi:hypothetical protein
MSPSRENQNGSRYIRVAKGVLLSFKEIHYFDLHLGTHVFASGFSAYPVFGVSHQVRAMIQKSVFPDETGRRWRAVSRPLAAGVMGVVGVAGLLMLIIEMDRAIPDSPMATQTAAPAAAAAAPAPGQTRSGSADPADPTQTAEANSTVPGEWLINDVAKTRAKPQVTPASPDPLPATVATADPHVETRVGSPPPSDTHPSEDEHGPGSPAGAVARGDTSRAVDDAASSCIEAPVGQAPDGKRWHYRFDREDHRKCWYLRARRHEPSRTSQRQRPRRTWANWNWRPWDFQW